MANKSYLLSPKAADDISSIYDYSVEQFGVKTAEEYIFTLNKSFQNLAQTPEIAKKCDFIKPKLRAYTVNSHLVFFKEASHGITVIRILHRSMSFSKHFN